MVKDVIIQAEQMEDKIMKKFAVLLVLFLVAAPATAGTLTVSGRAGLDSPPAVNASPSVMYGLGAEYGITSSLSVRAAVETTTYSVAGIQTTLTPVTADLIYRQTLLGMITPYVGAGLGYYTTTVGSNTNSTMGVQAETGIKFAVGGFDAGAEVRYMLPDTKNSNSGSMTYNAYMTGSFLQSFNI
jgi:outer membrane protein W